MSKLQDLIQELCPNGVEYKKLGDVCELSRGKVYSKEYIRDNKGEYPLYSSQTANDGELGKISTYDYDGEFLTWTTDGAYAGTIFYRVGKFSITNVCGLIKIKTEDINIRFLYFWLSLKAKDYVNQGMGNPKLMSNQIALVPIPVPPLPVQEEIVKILDRFAVYTAELQAELQARKEQYEYYRNLLLNFNHAYGAADEQQKKSVTTWGGHSYEIQWKTLEDVCIFENGKGHEKYIQENGEYIVINSKYISTSGKVKKYSNMQLSPVYKDMILLVMSDLPNGKALAKCFLVDKDNRYTLNQRIGGLTIKDNKVTSPKFLYYILDRNKQLLVYDNGDRKSVV